MIHDDGAPRERLLGRPENRIDSQDDEIARLREELSHQRDRAQHAEDLLEELTKALRELRMRAGNSPPDYCFASLDDLKALGLLMEASRV